MRKNLLLKILVIILALLFWVLQNLWRDHKETIELPVRFSNLADNLILLDETSDTIPLNFESRGLDYIVFHMSEVFIQVDASNFKYGKNSFRIRPSDLRNQGRVKIDMDEFEYDIEYQVELDMIIDRNIKLQIQFASAGDEEFFLKNKISDPNRKLLVTGPKSIIDELTEIKTEEINQKMLKDGKIIADLIIPDPRLRLIRNDITLEVTVAKQIDKIISLIAIDYPLDLGVSIIPQKISVMIMGPQEIIENIDRSSIDAFITRNKIKNLKPGESIFVPVEFTVPAGVKLVEYTPQQIQVIKND
ncbi:hypothetical protein ACFLYK_02935 [Candidatus Cloacimonadota bacterium]